MGSNEPVTLEFGPFRLEPDEGLWRHRTRIPLPPKETALLRLLAESRGRVVSKDTILDEVWRGDDVGEASITRCVRGLRGALREGARRGGTIETVYGRGYRLALAVHERPAPSQAGHEGALRIGVSPFESAGAEGAYLGPGIAGEVTDHLAKAAAEGITVIARQSAGHLHRGATSLLKTARELQLDYVLTGWLRLEGEALRVQVELLRVSDEALIWSDAFRAELSDVSRLPSAIAAGTVGELGRIRSRSTSAAAARRSVKAKSYLALLQGQFAMQPRTERGVRRAIELFERAIAWDPSHASAYAALADAHLMLGFWGYEAPVAIRPRVREALQRALALDRRLVPALASLGYLRYAIDFDPASALRAADRARALERDDARTQWVLGMIHFIRGRLDEAMAAFEASRDADPFSPMVAHAIAFTCFCAQRLEPALAEARALTASEPEYAIGHAIRATIAAAAGRHGEAIRSAEIAEGLARGNAVTLGTCAWALAKAGRTRQAAEILAFLERKAARRYVGPSHLAVAALGLGETEAALSWLERGLEERCMYLPQVAVDPRFAPLRGHARFERITAIARGQPPTAARRPSRAAASTAPAPAGAPPRSRGRE